MISQLLALSILPFALGAGPALDADVPGEPHYRKNIGESSYSVLRTVADQTYQRNAFLLSEETMVGPPSIRHETQWKVRPPFSDEAAEGALESRTRIIIVSRGRGSSGGGHLSGSNDQRYRLQVRIENQVILDQETGWTEIPATEEFQEWAERFARDLEADLRARN